MFLIGICYSDNQGNISYVAHKKGFSQCYKNVLQWANTSKEKYHFSDIVSIPDSGIIRISSSTVTFHGDVKDTCSNDLILILRTDSLKIKFETDSSSKSCLAERTAIQTLEKNDLTQLISSLPDSTSTISLRDSIRDVAEKADNLNTSGPSGGRVFFGVLTIIGGVVAGTVTIVDGNGGDEVATTSTRYPYNTTTATVHNRWSGRSGVIYTIDLTLSLSAIAAGISLLCK